MQSAPGERLPAFGGPIALNLFGSRPYIWAKTTTYARKPECCLTASVNWAFERRRIWRDS